MANVHNNPHICIKVPEEAPAEEQSDINTCLIPNNDQPSGKMGDRTVKQRKSVCYDYLFADSKIIVWIVFVLTFHAAGMILLHNSISGEKIKNKGKFAAGISCIAVSVITMIGKLIYLHGERELKN